MMHLTPNIRAMALVLLSFFLFNVADAFLNYTVDFYHFSSVGLYPILSYFFLILLFSKKMGGLKNIPKTKNLKLLLLNSFFATTGFIAFIIAITHITLAQTYTLVLTAPFWVALASIIIFKKPVGLPRWISIIVGFLGVLVVLRPGIETIDIASLFAVIGAISFAACIITVKKMGEDEPLINMLFYPVAVHVVVFIILNSFWLGWQPVLLEHVMFFILSGIAFFFADICFFRGFTKGDPSLLAPLHYSQIIWGALIGYLFFAETPDKWTLVGAAIIIVSGIYLVHRENAKEPS